MDVSASGAGFLFQMAQTLQASQQQATQQMQQTQAKVQEQTEQVRQSALEQIQARIDTFA